MVFPPDFHGARRAAQKAGERTGRRAQRPKPQKANRISADRTHIREPGVHHNMVRIEHRKEQHGSKRRHEKRWPEHNTGALQSG